MPFKVRLSIQAPGLEKELFAIPCPPGSTGTPKTIRWLMDEGQRRYKDIHHVTVSIHPFNNRNGTVSHTLVCEMNAAHDSEVGGSERWHG